MKKRFEFPDLLRGIAVVLMIQVHLTELFASAELSESIFGKISLFLGGIPAAPIFMLMMGYFLAFLDKSPLQMAKRGVRLFAGGILLNIGLNAHLLYRIWFDKWAIDPLTYIFGVDILPLAGLSLISIGFLKLLARKKWWAYLFFAVLVSAGSSLFSPYQFEYHNLKYIIAFIFGTTSWSYFALIPWLSYPLAGMALFYIDEKYKLIELVKNKITLIGFVLTSAILIYFWKYGFDISVQLYNYYTQHLTFFIWALGFMFVWGMIWYWAFPYLKNTLAAKYIEFLGRKVTLVYIFQWLIIGNIATAIYKTQGEIDLLFWFISITIISSVLAYIWPTIKNIFVQKSA